MALRFVREANGREPDFVVVKKTPVFAVGCKTGQRNLSRNVTSFSRRTNVPCFYHAHAGDRDYEQAESKARVIPLTRFCETLKV